MRMFAAPTHLSFARALWFLLAAGAMLLVAGCAPGGTRTGTVTGAQPSQTTTARPTTTASPNPTETGCPGANQQVTWSPPPVTILTPQQALMQVNVKVGDGFEIALPMGSKWKLAPMTSSVLKLDTPAGYGDTARRSCIWHFTAQASGRAEVQFSQEPICVKGKACPHHVALVDFTVQVSKS